MIYDVVAPQDQGKTLTAVAILARLIAKGLYKPDEVYANIHLRLPGCHIGTSEEIGECMVKMVEQKWYHKIFFLDEIDRMFPARFWADRTKTGRLLGLWQDIKLFHRFISTRHCGSSVDKMFRDAAQFVMVPKYDKERDLIDLSVINSLDIRKGHLILPNVSRHFTKYDRWEPVA
jgi:hypothetical protein